MPAKDVVQIVKDIITTIAVIAAGIWFLWQGTSRPRLKIEQTLVRKPFNDGSKKIHVVADVLISNVGNVVVDIPCGLIYVKQVLPAPRSGQISSEIFLRKPDIKNKTGDLCSFENYVIEPGEGDQVHYPFDVDESVRAIQFDSFIPNLRRPGKGWGLQSFYDLESAPNVKSSFEDATPPQAQPKILSSPR